jgi:hypothetical protein
MKSMYSAIAAAAVLVAGSTPSHALKVNSVQLGILSEKGGACPRDATLKAWAHADGPGSVKFIIHGASGSQSGPLAATAVKGAAGNYLATYTRKITIATDVDTKYRVEVAGSGKFSNWVPLKAECGPKPRPNSETKTKGSDAVPPAKKAGDDDGPKPRKTTKTQGSSGEPPAKKASGDDGKPTTRSAGKPTSKPNSKPVKTCKANVSVSRYGAYTKAGGIITARNAWRATVIQNYGTKWAHLSRASGRHESCSRKKGLFTCTVSAKPCDR